MAKSDSDRFMPIMMFFIFLPITVLTLFSDFTRKIYSRYFPQCVFYWSDNIDKYDKMVKGRNLILGIIFGTIVLGVVINLASSFLWEKVTK